jgi:regulator of replication initiation timing
MPDQSINLNTGDPPIVTTTAPNATSYTTAPQPVIGINEMLESANQEASQWKNRFTGLQNRYQADQKLWSETAAQLEDIRTQVATLSSTREQLEVERKNLSEELEKTKTEKQSLAASLERTNIIVTKFPNLLPFLDDGLLPQGTGEELVKTLEKFSEKVNAQKNASPQNKVDPSGSSLPNTPVSSGNTPADFLRQANAALKSGNREAYDSLYAQYLQASK